MDSGGLLVCAVSHVLTSWKVLLGVGREFVARARWTATDSQPRLSSVCTRTPGICERTVCWFHRRAPSLVDQTASPPVMA